MSDIRQFDAVWTDGKLRPKGIALDALFDLVMNDCVAMIRGAFPAEQLNDARERVYRWGLATEPKPPQTYLDGNYHAAEAGISPRQRTPHNFHYYNFYQIESLDDQDLSRRLLTIFDPLKEFQNSLTGNQGTYHFNDNGHKLRPQFAHYPIGGGFFGRHTHPLEPQRIGLILGMSRRGIDFTMGATHFLAGDRRLGTDEIHDIGDLLLFRFDIPHWITPIDIHEKFEDLTPRGRWTAILPYY